MIPNHPLLEQRSGSKMVHVPFRGNAPALTEVSAGRVGFMFYPMIGIADRTGIVTGENWGGLFSIAEAGTSTSV